MLKHEDGNLFEANFDRIVLVSTFPGNGKWEKGIAEDFAKHFPNAYKKYRQECLRDPSVGRSFIVVDDHKKVPIGCLITGFNASKKRTDPIQKVIKSTERAARQFLTQMQKDYPNHIVYSSELNDVFGEPVTQSEEIVKNVIRNSKGDQPWVIWRN